MTRLEEDVLELQEWYLKKELRTRSQYCVYLPCGEDAVKEINENLKSAKVKHMCIDKNNNMFVVFERTVS